MERTAVNNQINSVCKMHLYLSLSLSLSLPHHEWNRELSGIERGGRARSSGRSGGGAFIAFLISNFMYWTLIMTIRQQLKGQNVEERKLQQKLLSNL